MRVLGRATRTLPISHDETINLYQKYLDLIKFEQKNFGVSPTELRHLIGRLGELYCAQTTNGVLSAVANQNGFDVITGEGKKVSVKTTAQTSSGFIRMTASTANLADDIMLLQFVDGELSILFYGDIQIALDAARHYPEKNFYELDMSLAKHLKDLSNNEVEKQCLD